MLQNCYLVHFTLTLKSGERKSVVYYWQGTDAHREDRGASAMLTKELVFPSLVLFDLF